MTTGFDAGAFLAGYLAEVDEHLGSANRNLTDVAESARRGEAHPRAVRELYRSLHTIKGLSGMVGVDPTVDLSHAMEAVLRGADRSGTRLAGPTISVLAQGLQVLEQQVRAVADGRPPAVAAEALLQALASAAADIGAAPRPGMSEARVVDGTLLALLAPAEREQLALGVRQAKRAVAVEFVPSPARAARDLTITTVRDRITKVAEIVRVLPTSRTAGPDAPGGLAFTLVLVTAAGDAALAELVDAAPESVRVVLEPAPSPGPARAESRSDERRAEGEAGSDSLDDAPAGPANKGVVRVEVARLDDALDRLSALVVTRFRLARAVSALRATGADVGSVRALDEIVHENGRQLRDLRAAIMKARMIAVAELLERVPLLVRGLAASTGKKVRLELDAGRAELDKTVGERIFPAIVHLVRNAIDHAIEPPEERVRAGKPAEGLIRVTCFERNNNQLELTVADDGRGIDAAAVARRAGKPTPTTPDGLLALLAIPGLSTMDRPTTTSGRGLGVDIVQQVTVGELGGELALETRVGAGTQFTLRLPLSITIQDAFSFRCGEQTFAVPVAMVDEVIELDPARFVSSSGFATRRHISLIERRGAPLPIVDLDGLFRLDRVAAHLRQALVVRRNGEPIGFEVDQVLGQQEVVVRPIDDPLVRVPGVVGATDLGDGRPTLVLDLVALTGTLSLRSRERARA
jgi:two-component system chemotaxis sensor kinase CheA